MDRRLFFLMHRAHRALFAYANARAVEALGVSAAQLSTLHHVARHDGCSLTEIAYVLDLNKSAVGSLVRRLERARAVRCEPNPDDGRGRRVFLTAKGRAIESESLPLLRRFNAEITAGFGAHEVDTVLRFLSSIVERYADDQPTAAAAGRRTRSR
jgi:DNA-binding MarR family transcriptional regulator